MKYINQDLVKAFVKVAGNKIFTLKFIKKDGTIRTMSCRRGVKKNLKGKQVVKSENLITVFDMAKQDYRSVSVTRVIEATVKGTKLVAVGNDKVE